MSNDATDGCYFNEGLFVEGIALEQINSTNSWLTPYWTVAELHHALRLSEL